MVTRTMSVLRDTLCCVLIFILILLGFHSAIQFKEMAMSNLGVKSPIHFHNVNTLKTFSYYLLQR